MDTKCKRLSFILMINLLVVTILEATLANMQTYFISTIQTTQALNVFCSIILIMLIYLSAMNFWKSKLIKFSTTIMNIFYAFNCVCAISSSMNHFNLISNNFTVITSHFVLCFTFLITLAFWFYFVFIKKFLLNLKCKKISNTEN